MKHFMQIVTSLKSFNPSLEFPAEPTLTDIFGKVIENVNLYVCTDYIVWRILMTSLQICVNSFSITDEEMMPIGVGLYLG